MIRVKVIYDLDFADEYEQFMDALTVAEHNNCPSHLLNSAQELSTLEPEQTYFSSKLHVDEFIEWLMTLPGWTDDYCPIRVKDF